jgi:hypothetical protein
MQTLALKSKLSLRVIIPRIRKTTDRKGPIFSVVVAEF